MDAQLMMELEQNYAQSKAIEEQLELIERNIVELQLFDYHLDALKDVKNKEMLAPIGKGVFMETQVKDSKLFVDVGAGILVKKTPEETKKVLQEQLKRLGEMRLQLRTQYEEITSIMQEIIQKTESK